MKRVVWDLFGGGQNSVYKALKDVPGFEVWTFDVTEPTRDKHVSLDLAAPNLERELSKYPKPDIVAASPPCASFSNALAMKAGGG